MNKVFFALVFILIFDYQAALAVTPITKEPPVKEVIVEPLIPGEGFDKIETKLKKVLVPIYGSIEIFRKKEASHFTIVRDKVKARLGINLATDAFEKIKPFLAPPTAPSAVPGGISDEKLLQIDKFDSPVDYLVLIGSTALASFFTNTWLFYAISILLIYLIIRLLFKMFI